MKFFCCYFACTNDKIFGRLAAIMDRMDVSGEGIYGTITQREARRAEVLPQGEAWHVKS
jgi:hypothetical protein